MTIFLIGICLELRVRAETDLCTELSGADADAVADACAGEAKIPRHYILVMCID